MLRSWLIALSVSGSLLGGCATSSDADIEDCDNDVATGQADSPFAKGSAAAQQILELVNDPGVSEADLDNGAGLSQRVSEAIVAYRDGADREPGTADDKLFRKVSEVDAIPYVGAA